MCEFRALLMRGSLRELLMEDVVLAHAEQDDVVLVDVLARRQTCRDAAIVSTDTERREILLAPRPGRTATPPGA